MNEPIYDQTSSSVVIYKKRGISIDLIASGIKDDVVLFSTQGEAEYC